MGKDSIAALEQEKDYSSAYQLLMSSQEQLSSSEPNISETEDPSRRPFDEQALPFEIRAAFQDAVLALRAQADTLAAKARTMQSRYINTQDPQQPSQPSEMLPPDEFGLPVQFVSRRASHSEDPSTSTSTGADQDSVAPSTASSSSTSKEKPHLSAAQHRDVPPGPSSLRNASARGSTSSSPRSTPSHSAFHASQAPSLAASSTATPSGPDTVAAAEKRVKFAEPEEEAAANAELSSSELDLTNLPQDPAARADVLRQSEAAALGSSSEEDSGSESDEPFPMDDDVPRSDKPSPAPSSMKPPISISGPNGSPLESEDPMLSISSHSTEPTSFPSSLDPRPHSLTPSNSSRWSRLAAQQAEQVSKLRDLLGTDAPSHREPDFYRARSTRYDPLRHGAKPRQRRQPSRPIKSPAPTEGGDPFDELAAEEEDADGADAASEKYDMARSLPINVMGPRGGSMFQPGQGDVRYQVKTSLPTHENLLVPQFEMKRRQGSSSSPSSAADNQPKRGHLQNQLRKATENAAMASLTKSAVPEDEEPKVSTDADPQAASRFAPEKLTKYNTRQATGAGPSSLSQSLSAHYVPPEMQARAEQRERDAEQAANQKPMAANEDPEADHVARPGDAGLEEHMEFEGDTPNAFLPPHLWVRMCVLPSLDSKTRIPLTDRKRCGTGPRAARAC